MAIRQLPRHPQRHPGLIPRSWLPKAGAAVYAGMVWLALMAPLRGQTNGFVTEENSTGVAPYGAYAGIRETSTCRI